MHMADSLFCTTETNSTVKQLYSNKDLFKKKRNGILRHATTRMNLGKFYAKLNKTDTKGQIL